MSTMQGRTLTAAYGWILCLSVDLEWGTQVITLACYNKWLLCTVEYSQNSRRYFFKKGK